MQVLKFVFVGKMHVMNNITHKQIHVHAQPIHLSGVQVRGYPRVLWGG